MRIRQNQKVPAGDGSLLATDVYLPASTGPFPTLVTRTPYHRNTQLQRGLKFTAWGYAFVVQDVRGKFESEGAFHPLRDDAPDGQALLDWTANQSWCNGRIGMWGSSYLGIIQVPAAMGGHEALKCIAPAVAPISYFRDWIRHDGCFAWANNLRWGLQNGATRCQVTDGHVDWDKLFACRNLEAAEEMFGLAVPHLREWAEHDRDDDYWQAIDQTNMHQHVRVPGLHIGGWFDHISRGQYAAYTRLSKVAATPEARAGQRLLIGPWGHRTHRDTLDDRTSYGQWSFGPDADLNIYDAEHAFFDQHLRDLDLGSHQPRVKLFIMGPNRWESFSDWPIPESEQQRWYLSSTGKARHGGNGALTRSTSVNAGEDAYTYDPADPCPTCGGAVYWGIHHVGPVDQLPILNRRDVLYFRSAPLERKLTVIGDIKAQLTVACNVEDTDLMVKFCVEQADGAVMVLGLGDLRLRYRNSFADPEPLTRGNATTVTLAVAPLAYQFQAGSRIGLVITSSDAPRILPHHNAMTPPLSGETAQSARVTLLWGPQCPSYLQLPVVDLD